jgi:hypothetical protein
MRKRLACFIPEELHKKLWKISKKRNITLTRYVTRALIRYVLDEQKYEKENDDKKDDHK